MMPRLRSNVCCHIVGEVSLASKPNLPSNNRTAGWIGTAEGLNRAWHNQGYIHALFRESLLD